MPARLNKTFGTNYNDTMYQHYLTPLIGRDQEMIEVQRLLRANRLVTITGPGGSGKSRLATEIASALTKEFAHGAYFISLAAINDPTLVIPTIAQAIGSPESLDHLPFDSLKKFLSDQQILLLLDNFEQLISAAPLLTELLQHTAQLKLLITSREALRLQSEQEFPLNPLPLFDQQTLVGSSVENKNLSEFASIQLFVERAQKIQPDFQLTSANGHTIANICACVDGLPLAIELAAARIKLLTPQAMLTLLQESPLNLLTNGPRDLPERHQTLRDTIQWSYDLLTVDEQRTFRWLAVFIGGCTLEAAIKVLEYPSPIVTLDHIDSLLNKSLIRQITYGSEPHLVLLETIREFGLEQLEQTAEYEDAQLAHANYYLSLVEKTERHLTGAEQNVYLNRLERDQDNIRAALRWGVKHQDTSFIVRLVGAFWQFWFLTGRWSEGRRWLDEAISMGQEGSNPPQRAKALHAAAMLIHYQGDLARARNLCKQSIKLYKTLNDTEGLLTALLHLCRILDYQADNEPLQTHVEEALAITEMLPDVLVKAQAYVELAPLIIEKESLETAIHKLEISERIYRALDNPAGLANSIFVRGAMLFAAGNQEEGQRLIEDAENLSKGINDHRLRMMIYSRRLKINWQQGNYPLARQAFKQLVTHHQPTLRIATTLEIFADILYNQGLYIWAARVLGFADRASHNVINRPRRRLSKNLKQVLLDTRIAVRNQLGEEAFTQALQEGQALTADDLFAIPHPSPTDTLAQTSPTTYIEPLTPRETEVLQLLTQALSSAEIAEQLVISRRTVDAHLRAIYNKLGVNSRFTAVHIARKHRLIT